MSFDNKKADEARNALLDAVTKNAANASNTQLLHLAEAMAWAMYPNQSHGGSGVTTAK